MMLLHNNDQGVWSTAVDCIHQYFKLSKEDEFIKDMLTSYSDDLGEAKEDSEEFDKKVKVFVRICQQNIPKLNTFIETLLFTTELKPWQLEVIANTAKIFGPKMYTKGVLRLGLSSFVDQYIAQTKTPEKGELMLYTMKHLVEFLNDEHEGMFVTQAMDFVKKFLSNPETNYPLLQLSLEVLSQFYEYMGQGRNEYLPTILDNLIPLLVNNTPRSPEIFAALGRFFKAYSFNQDQIAGVEQT